MARGNHITRRFMHTATDLVASLHATPRLVTGWLGRAPAMKGKARRLFAATKLRSFLRRAVFVCGSWLRGMSLSQQFALAGAGVILIGMSAVGAWVAKSIEERVTYHSAAAAALYMDAFITPLAQDLASGPTIKPENMKRLDEIMALREINENVLSVKVWQHDGSIAYSNFPDTIGKRFKPTNHLKEAWSGVISAHFSDLGHDDDQRERQLGVDLIEIYAPIREASSRRIIAVSEFYMRAEALRQSVNRAQLHSWAIVGGTGSLILLALYNIVRRGTITIEQQKQALILRAEQNLDLRKKIEDAYWRADQLNEKFLSRLGADLHDGPAQLLGFALMRLDALPLDMERIAASPRDAATYNVIRQALDNAITDIRSLSRGLLLPELDSLNVQDAATLVVNLHKDRTSSVVVMSLPAEPIEASKEVKVCVYRFVQEALNNAYKHANGNGQYVKMALADGQLVVSVSDKGPGVERNLDNGDPLQQLGLVGIRDRVEALAGTFEILSPPDGGTELIIKIKLSKTPGKWV